MTPANFTVVAIDDDPLILEILTEALTTEVVRVETAISAVEGLSLVHSKKPGLVFLDLGLPDTPGIEVLPEILAIDPGVSVVLLTGDYSTDTAVKAICMGATDYLTKPVSLERLHSVVDQLVAQAQRRSVAIQLDRDGLRIFNFCGIIGRSASMLDLFSNIQRIAPHYKTALILGPTGSGKELVAKALHQSSPVAKQPFIVANCAAFTESLIETELFGHVKGAFTGAITDRAGIFETANGGTVFLDEIGELPLPAQAKLLRVLQNSEIQRVGSSLTKKVSVRVIAATNRNLREMVQGKTFREDLYYRLAMVELELPPLADRREDLPLLLRYFVENFSHAYGKPIQGLSRRAQNVLNRHLWPGNVRELENVIGKACMLASNEFIDVQDLPEYLNPKHADGGVRGLMSLAQLEKQHTLQVLEQLGGNKVAAAEVLGISRATLYRILSEPGTAEPKLQ